MTPFRGVMTVRFENGVESEPVDLAEAMEAFEAELQLAREQARRWYTRWCWTFGALLVAVATVVWGALGIWIGAFK